MDTNTEAPIRDAPPPEVGPPILLWSFAFNAEQTLAVYAALRTYLRALIGQPEEDFQMIERISRLLGQMRQAAVKASESLALKEDVDA